MTPTIAAYPAFDALYNGFYQRGLEQLRAANQIAGIRSTTRGFPAFDQRFFALRLQPSGRKIFIDAIDGAALDPRGLEWCDLYGKVNLDPQRDAPPKVVAIGPSFGLRFRSELGAAFDALRTALLCGKHLKNPKAHVANYIRQLKRLPLEAYEPGVSQADYVFFLATIWGHKGGGPECNRFRADFIRAGRAQNGLEFEGGFAPQRAVDIGQMGFVPGFESLTIERRYHLDEYLGRLKRSAVAFNTPAVARCHGWKLGEYLALGKAIISTPLTRELPAPLEHGKQLHFVDGSPESMRQALELLCRDDAYRRQLESAARAYWLQHLQPARVVGRLIERASA